MRIGRTIPPAASPIYLRDILNGLKGLIRGPQEVDRFRGELKDYFGVSHCFLLSSGKAALTIILKALHSMYPDRDEVLIPAFCCYSVPSAIVRAGLKIRLCDIDPSTLDFDYEQLKNLIDEYTSGESTSGHNSKNTKLPAKGKGAENESVKLKTQNKTSHAEISNSERQGNSCELEFKGHEVNGTQIKTPNKRSDASRLLSVLTVNLFGFAADVYRARSLLVDSSITIIEDSAQTIEAESNRNKLGTRGDIGFFSLGRSKPISVVEGGIIVTNREDIAMQIESEMKELPEYRLLERLKTILQAVALMIFQKPNFFWFPKLFPFLRIGDTIYDPSFKILQMSAVQAGMAKNWKLKLNDFERARRNAAKVWKNVLDTTEMFLYSSQNDKQENCIRFPVRIRKSDLWRRMLAVSEKYGIGVMLTYPDAINGIPELREQFNSQDFPAAQGLARQLLTIPVHPLLSNRDMEKIRSKVSSLTGNIEAWVEYNINWHSDR